MWPPFLYKLNHIKYMKSIAFNDGNDNLCSSTFIINKITKNNVERISF